MTQGSYEIFDSAGVVITVTNSAVARAPMQWVIDSLPEITIGSATGSEPYLFHSIAGLVAQPGGGLWIMDGGSRQLRLFSVDGAYVRSLGRRGRGPGEFESPLLIPAFMVDTLVVFDRRTRGLTVLASGGDILATTRITEPRLARTNLHPVGVHGRHVLFDDRGIIMFGTGGLEAPQPAVFRVVDAISGTVTVLGEFRGQQMFTATLNGMKYNLPLPFDIRPSAAVGRNTFFVTAGEEPEILEYDTAANLRRIFRVRETARPVTNRDLDAFIAKRAEEQPDSREAARQLRELYSGLPLTSVMPAFQTLLVDESGMLWAKTYDPLGEGPSVWMVFDAAGRACGTVAVPRDMQPKYIAHDRVVAVWRDRTDVEYVRRHRLTRTNNTESTC